jgi:hypothetical protein
MLQTIVRVCQIVFFVLAIVALAWWLGGKLGGESRRALDPFQRTLAERVVAEVAAELPQREDLRRVIVVPVAGDLDRRVTDMLARRLDEKYEIVSASKVDDAIRDDWKGVSPTTRKAALALGRGLARATQADGLVFATVDRSSGEKGLGAQVTLEAHLIRLSDGAEVPGGVARSTRRIESRASLDYFAPWMEQVHWLWRAFLWVLFTAGLPFAMFPIVQAVTARESNRLNALLLAGLVACDVAFAAALLGFRPGWLGAVVLVIAALSAFVYDFAICDRIDEVRK